MGVSPAQRIAAFASGDKASLDATSMYVVALAKLSGLEIVDELPRHDAPVEVVGGDRLMLHIEVDLAAERSRLTKELARLRNDIARATQKLANASFVGRAPASIVAEERARLQANEATLQKVSAQIDRLSGTA
jgi:valyl-tRNA synthetase